MKALMLGIFVGVAIYGSLQGFEIASIQNRNGSSYEKDKPFENFQNLQVIDAPKGGSFAVWKEGDISSSQIKAAHVREGKWDFESEFLFSNVSVLASTPTGAGQPRIGCDGQGNALAVWTNFNGTDFIIQGAYYDCVLNNWSAPLALSSGSYVAFKPQVAFDSSGKAMIVWQSYERYHWVIQGLIYNPTTAACERFNLSRKKQTSHSPSIKVANSGETMIVWQQDTRGGGAVQALHCQFEEVGKSKKNAVTISSKNERASSPELAVDGEGNSLVIWKSVNEEKGEAVHWAYYSRQTNQWQVKNSPVIPTYRAIQSLNVEMDQKGGAYAWIESSEGSEVAIQKICWVRE